MEAVAWMDRDVAWDVISDVHKKRWSKINGPEGTQRYSRPLYASPVVPVGVSEEVEIIEDWLAMAKSCPLVRGIVRQAPVRQIEIDAIDAILAALTGEDTATLGLSGKNQTGGDACTS